MLLGYVYTGSFAWDVSILAWGQSATHLQAVQYAVDWIVVLTYKKP